MSLATLEQLVVERRRLRVAYRQLQNQATDRNFVDKVDALDARKDQVDQQCSELVETLVAEGVDIPTLLLYDLMDMTLERLIRRDPQAGKRLRMALEMARSRK